MLEVLRIQDYALVENLEIEFSPGLNVLTGETGAGKSILVGALMLALGGRASADAVRMGAEKAIVEAVFRLSTPSPRLAAYLTELDILLEDEILILTRTVNNEGRSRSQANGRQITVTMLASIGDELVDLHGQHEHQSLLHPERQLELLDAFAGSTSLAAEVTAQVARLSGIRRTIESLAFDDRERMRQADYLRYEVYEIDKASLQPGEEEELRSRLHRITHAEAMCQLVHQAYSLLYESETGSVIDGLDAVQRDLGALSAIDATFHELEKQIEEARSAVETVALELRNSFDAFEYDPGELDALNERLSRIGALKRKYGSDIESILAHRARSAALLDELDHRDERLEQLRKEYEEGMQAVSLRAEELSRRRREVAPEFDRVVQHTLTSLDMPKVQFATRLERVLLGLSGLDRAEFLLAANVGEPSKPLRMVASGGEISRVMLALKSVFSEKETVPTLVFDEIDAGVGGAAARRVAEKMSNIGHSVQVLCITHLPQIASAGNAHYLVSKEEKNGRTCTGIKRLEGAERSMEIARLLDGSVSAVSLKHAETLLSDMSMKTQGNKKGKS